MRMLIPSEDMRLLIKGVDWQPVGDTGTNQSRECPFDVWFRFVRDPERVACYLYRTHSEAANEGEHPLRSKLGQGYFTPPESGTMLLSLPIEDDPGESGDVSAMILRLSVQPIPFPWFSVWGYVGPTVPAAE